MAESNAADGLLLVSGYQDVEQWSREIAALLPGVDFAVWDQDTQAANADAVSMIAIDDVPPDGFFGRFPSLRCVQYLGHGVGDVVARIDPAADIAITRLVDPSITSAMVEYCIGHVFREHLQVSGYRGQQERAEWARIPALSAPETRVGVLGLGGIGEATARAFVSLGFDVAGWSRSPREIKGVDCHHGFENLDTLLATLDHVVAILPETAETIGLFGTERLAACKPGAHLINVGRGSLVDPVALIAALDSGQLSAATLDVFASEPLDASSPLWAHPQVTITPHSAGGGSPTSGIETTVENYQRLHDGRPLLHEWSS